jgi:outer membrane protein TolC
VDIDQTVREANEALPGFTGGHLELGRTSEQRVERERIVADALASPLTLDAAVRVAVVNSPALQALIAQRWSELAAAAQSGRIANPVFSFGRLRSGSELEIDRLLSVGLLDLVTYPQRQAVARTRIAGGKVQLASTVVEQVTQVRYAWVRAVAARQRLEYAERVDKSAKASAELARRMAQVGNFSRLQRARQQAFYADAAAQLAAAGQAAVAAREELVRELGLADGQAARLALPERLPDLPGQPRSGPDVTATALQQRLDVQLARAQLESSGRARGLNLATWFVDIEGGPRRNTVFDDAAGTKQTARGLDLDIRLPLLDVGDAQRAQFDAQTLAAANRYDSVVRAASSQLRESYAAYRAAYGLARHYRDEVVPLRKTISEENQLRYNGMLIGVFELLADNRDQIAAVLSAIDAQKQFWLADVSLSANVAGVPVAIGAAAAGTATARGGDGH